MSPSQLQLLASASYFVAATLFLLGLQRMASPRTARSGIQWAGAGMLLATVATLLLPGLHNLGLITLATMLGALAVLDEIARIKQSDAILTDAANFRISDRFLRRQGWERHTKARYHRNYIKRFYGEYSRVRRIDLSKDHQSAAAFLSAHAQSE